MKIYFYSKTAEPTTDQQLAHDFIFKFFKDNGLTVLSNLKEQTGKPGDLVLENMNALIIEGAGLPKETGYLTALSLAQQKPILYLLPKGKELPEPLRPLLQNPEFKKLFLFKYYNNKLLPAILLDFLDLIETGELRKETPNLKFTLRFTPRVDRYLNWKSKKTKIAKADFIRQVLDQTIQADKDYQAQLRKTGEEKG